ncbi:MAG: DNA-3-methyladenine glycosylase [Marinilabiliales bacterium]|nr:MAG: DNA-3-methyladenine glycosylase [Marinilabiliales bacterium]
MILPESFFIHDDVVSIAKNLLGKELFTNINGEICSGIISETEAYAGITDKASHAYGSRRTKRTETMYQRGGRTYVYLCYGIHHLVNIVTAKENIPHAVLIRSIIPQKGINSMLLRSKNKNPNNLSNGPGKLSKVLGITTVYDNIKLNKDIIWIEDNDYSLDSYNIMVTKRIGIDYAEEDAHLPYRFLLMRNDK